MEQNSHHHGLDPMEPSAYGQPRPPRYVMLDGSNSLQPPPRRRNLPRYYSRRGGDDGGCCGCVCLFCCCLLVVLLALAAALVYAYVVIDPKAPSYKVDHLGVAAFDVRPDLTLHTELQVGVRAENPNAQIGIAYGKGGLVTVLYREARLCSGELPEFFQGHRNTTTIRVVLRGENSLGSGLQAALMESRHAGSVPLDVYVKVPVVLRLAGALDLRKLTVSVKCSLVVDSLSPNKKVAIKSAAYKFNVEI